MPTLWDKEPASSLKIDNTTRSKIDLYFFELLKWNKKINLISRKNTEDTAIKLFLESFFWFEQIQDIKIETVLDLGSGAGFPGLVLKILNPSWQVTLVDALEKRISFLNWMAANLNLDGIKCLHYRIENLENVLLSNSFDLVCSKGLGSFENIADISHKFLKKNGYLMVRKPSVWQKEWVSEKKGLEESNLQLLWTKEITIGNKLAGILVCFVKP